MIFFIYFFPQVSLPFPFFYHFEEKHQIETFNLYLDLNEKQPSSMQPINQIAAILSQNRFLVTT